MLIKKPRISSLFASLLFISVVSVPLFSQDKTVISPYISLQYFKNSDDLRYLQTTLTYSFDRMEIPLQGMEISFYYGTDRQELLGTTLTNEKGIATLNLAKSAALPKNGEGLWPFSTGFPGNDTIEAGTADLLIRDVRLEMNLSEVDSIKTISFTAFKSENNKEIPVSGEVVMVYVPRMFSLLPVGEANLDENGSAILEFPSDLPGDSVGNLTIISKFEEHPDFGNVERRIVQKWGVPFVNSTPVAHRALWTKTPPWWMIITLSILLTGVWGHYLFAIISLIRIKMLSKKESKTKTKFPEKKIAR
jgi:hypothetical protein